ncbi:MAG: glycosyltransferase [Rhizonema sp. PD38]|nr:glycosyltransferase [Rhizonema sp. PD38]
MILLLETNFVMIYAPLLEAFGFDPLEANACGTPVITIAEGGIRETIINGSNGFFLGDDNPVIIGQAITKFLKHPELVD